LGGRPFRTTLPRTCQSGAQLASHVLPHRMLPRRRTLIGTRMRVTSTCPARWSWSSVVLLALAVLLQAQPAAAASLTRGPYLQLLTTQSVTVVWNTDTAAECSLAIRRVGGSTSVIRGTTGTVCAIEVGGLR